jgi:uncharacterized protein YdcH (DUF465 family)
MNSYGYDYYVPNDAMYFDETSYIESLKPLNKVENFENEVNDLINDVNQSGANQQTTTLTNLLEKKNKLCNMIYDNLQKCHKAFKYKSYELQQTQSQLFLLYILLIFSIIFIFYQRININNLNQLIYILKYNKMASSMS